MADKAAGNANRKRQALEAALARDEATLTPELLAAIGDPPAAETSALPWVTRALLLLTHEIIKAPDIPLTERARHVREMAKSLGMVYPRAELEAILKALKEKGEARSDKSGGNAKLQAGAWTGGAEVVEAKAD